jgi:CubicO group peptidase (beta-lactamase class C family)
MAADPSLRRRLRPQSGIALLSFLLSVLPAAAQPERPPGPGGPCELQLFLDGFFEGRMNELRVPGAAVAVVKDGAILTARGYGMASRERGRRVSAETTLFRVASISKVFTATAVMQLAQQGRLSLNQDLNRYLRDLQLDSNFPAPVTLFHLLTHTGGFDERFIGIAARTTEDAAPLGPYLAANMPLRVRPPGELISYSNHGMALAGYIVESVAAQPFADYMDEHVLRPLDMARSSFKLPAHLAPDLATGYELRNGELHPMPLDHLDSLAPSGGLSATATDLAHFMIAQLQFGWFGSARILSEESVREMQRRQFTHHTRLPGFALGFYENFENGRRLLVHGGSWRGFTSLMALIPDENVGFVILLNRTEPRLVTGFLRTFMNRYYPTDSRGEQKSPSLQAELRRFTGYYRSTRYARRTVEKLAVLLAQFRVTPNEDGSLTIRDPWGLEEPRRWFPVEPLLFQSDRGEEFVAFRENSQKQVTHLFLQALGSPLSLERLAWYEAAPAQFSLLAFVFFLFLSACVASPLRWLISGSRASRDREPPLARTARWAGGIASALYTIFFVSVALAFVGVTYVRLEYGMPAWLAAMFVLPYASVTLTATMPVFVVLSWRRGWWTPAGRIYFSLLTLACLAFVPFLVDWNLLGFRF